MDRVFSLQFPPGRGAGIEADALDGDLRRVELADPTPDGGVPLDGAFLFTAGRKIRPEFVPRRMRWNDPSRRAIPDFDHHLILNVSGRARGLIEALEPGVHQFLPVTFQAPDGAILEQRYFLIVCNRIDSVDRAGTTLLLWQDRVWEAAHVLPRDERPTADRADAEPRLVFNLGRIGRCHLWRDKHLRQGPFLSATLAAAVAESGLTGLDLEGSGFEAV